MGGCRPQHLQPDSMGGWVSLRRWLPARPDCTPTKSAAPARRALGDGGGRSKWRGRHSAAASGSARGAEAPRAPRRRQCRAAQPAAIWLQGPGRGADAGKAKALENPAASTTKQRRCCRPALRRRCGRLAAAVMAPGKDCAAAAAAAPAAYAPGASAAAGCRHRLLLLVREPAGLQPQPRRAAHAVAALRQLEAALRRLQAGEAAAGGRAVVRLRRLLRLLRMRLLRMRRRPRPLRVLPLGPVLLLLLLARP